MGGKSFGWAHVMEREAIRQHLKARGRYREGYGEILVASIQMRLHRDYHKRKPPIGVRRRTPAPPPVEDFTAEELALIAERFAGANDPVGQSVHAKASARAGQALQDAERKGG